MKRFRDIITGLFRKTNILISLPLWGGLGWGIVASCASIGSPDGGRYDEEPPYVVSASPADKSTGHTRVKKVRITFNEFIKLENASEKVVVSPPQNEQPDLYTTGKSIVMTLFDTLQANTTYTIDFADAIVDNNEGNPMGNYTYSFSTGDAIDTLEVSGHVIMAENMEPVKSILVGLYRIEDNDLIDSPDLNDSIDFIDFIDNIDNIDNIDDIDSIDKIDTIAPLDSIINYQLSIINSPDTLLTTTPLQRVSRTNGDGRFSIKGVAPGRYRIYALNDMDGDYRFSQKSEMLAFDTIVIQPSCGLDLRHDTIWADSTHYEKVLHIPYTHFYPDNIVMRAFLEEGQAHYLLKTERQEPTKFKLYFTAPADTLPEISIVENDIPRPLTGDWRRDGILVQPSMHLDTLTYWITDTAMAYRDTLSLHIRYLETDTLGDLVPRTDTLDLVPRTTRARQVKDLEAQVDKWVKQQTKQLERFEKKLERLQKQYPDSVFTNTERIDTARHLCPLYTPSINLTIMPGGALSPDKNLTITCPEPIDVIDTTRIHFTIKQDSLQIPAPYILERDTLDPCCLHFYAEWRPDDKFTLEIDSAAITTVYGWSAVALKREIAVSGMDAYGALFIQIANLSRLLPPPTDSIAPSVIVQLLDKGDKVIRQQRVDEKGRADFFFLSPSETYMRCFVDTNGDGLWTTGDYASGRQPERVYYFPRPFAIKAKWDLEQTWDPLSIKEMEQKPANLIKQKEKQKKSTSARERNMKRDKEGRY